MTLSTSGRWLATSEALLSPYGRRSSHSLKRNGANARLATRPTQVVGRSILNCCTISFAKYPLNPPGPTEHGAGTRNFWAREAASDLPPWTKAAWALAGLRGSRVGNERRRRDLNPRTLSGLLVSRQ